MDTRSQVRSLFLPFIICFTAYLFFMYEFVLQVSPNVMTTEMMRDLNIDAAGVGFISGAYYISYSAMQIPAGLLYDRYGPRFLLTIACLVCAFGSFAFGLTDSMMAAATGRFLIGGGSAFAFIGCLVLISRWFPAKYFAFLAGILQTLGSIGALVGEAPLAVMVQDLGWRETIAYIGVVGLLLALVIWLLVRDSPDSTRSKDTHKKKGELKRLLYVGKKPQTWWVAVYAFSAWAPILIFGGLWGVPYLQAVYGVSAAKAAAAVSMVWIAIAIGSPLVGWFSDFVGRRKFPLALCSLLGLLSSLAIVYVSDISFAAMFLLLFIFGFSASTQTLSFAVVKDNNKPSMVGTASGINNMAVVIGGILFQPLVGLLLRWNWDGTIYNNVPFYQISDYRFALLLLPLCSLVGLLVSLFFVKETHCEPIYGETV